MANTGFVVNTHRVDPYKNFKFRVLWDGKPVLGVSKCGALKRTTEVVKHRSGGDNSHDHKSPGRSSLPSLMGRPMTNRSLRSAVSTPAVPRKEPPPLPLFVAVESTERPLNALCTCS